MKIILVRHGMPNINSDAKLSSLEYQLWLKKYDHVSLDQKSYPCSSIYDYIDNSVFSVCSDLLRSHESVNRLGLSVDILDSSFNECVMPALNLKYLKLSPKWWGILSRITWELGYSNNSESYENAVVRAKKCVVLLEGLAKKYNTILLSGHGLINLLIYRQLKRKGWVSKGSSPRKYWQYCFLTKNDVA